MRMISSLILMVGLLYTFTATAQNTSIGVRGGVNFFNAEGDDAPEGDARTAANFGAFYNHSVSNTFGVTGELNFMGKGFKPENTGTISANNIEVVRLNYLEIPVYGNFFFGEGRFRPKLFAGPTFGFLLSAESEDNDGNTTELDDSFSDNEYGLLAGAGFHYRFNDANWFIMDVRYGMGLSQVPDDDVDWFNRGFSINVGVSFPLDNY